MVYVKSRHIRKDWRDGEFIPFEELRDFIHRTWTEEIQREVKDATPPSRPESTQGVPLADSWFIHLNTGVWHGVNDKSESLIYNTKVVRYDGLSHHLISLLHNGRKGFCAKGLRKGSHGPKLLVFKSFGRIWKLPCVKGINPHRMISPSRPGRYDIRKDLDEAFYKGEKLAARRLREWHPL